jgi:hypothetical protein
MIIMMNENRICPTIQLPACRRGLLEKLVVTQLVKKFPAFYGTQRFITTFTRTPYPKPDESSYSVSLRCILILSH